MPVIGAACLQLAVAQACQKGYYLDGLAKAHLISQNASCLLAVQFPHPPDTCLLIPGQQKAGMSNKTPEQHNTTTAPDQLIIGPLSLLILNKWPVSVAQLMCCKARHNGVASCCKPRTLNMYSRKSIQQRSCIPSSFQIFPMNK